MNKVELKDLVGGALQEKFNKSFEKVIDNLQDVNTSFKVKRKISISLDFVQNEARDDVHVEVAVVEKLAPQAPMTTSFAIGKDLNTGEMYAEEYGKQIKGQMKLDDYSHEQVVDGKTIDTDTGEIVKDPETVVLFSQLNEERNRETLVVVNARIPEFPFDSFINQETFCINLQAKFINDPETDLALVLKFAGTVETGTVTEYGDDGVTQKATVKTGIASKSEAVVPNPVTLRPYRTFLEVEQPKSDFIFRMKQDKYDGINCAIIEADGGAWKMEATKAIKDYLQYELSEYEQFTVIS